MERTYRITLAADGKWQCQGSGSPEPFLLCDTLEEAEELLSDMAREQGGTRVMVYNGDGDLLRDRTFAPKEGHVARM